MKMTLPRTLVAALALIATTGIISAQLYEWRGPDRTGIYKETGLLKKWPAGGPALVWEYESSGIGYSQPLVTDDAVYITGRKDSLDVLTSLSLDGKKKWETPYGKAWLTNHQGSRCTPTYYKGNLYLISGSGDIVCVTAAGKIKWTRNHFRLYDSKPLMFGISESPLVYDNIVVTTPGGKKASLVAFNINDGSVAWESEVLDTEPQYMNPKLVEHGGRKMVVTVLGSNIVAVDAKNGKLVWKINYAEANAGTGRVMKNHAITPVYRDGFILIANGYNWVALKLKLSADGSSVEKVWENRGFDPQHGGVLLLGDQIYGATHQSKPVDMWTCVDWNTGKILWQAKWYVRGSIISADGMLYIFEEKSGHVGLVKPDPAKFDLVSEFQVTKGEGPYWGHPAIKNGRLFIRHGEYLVVYNIKA